MGFFTKQDGGSAVSGDITLPVTLERMQQVIAAMDYSVDLDDEGYLWGFWDERYFDFRIFGDAVVLQVRGVWGGIPEPAEVEALTLAANAWNTDKLFPKVFVLAKDDGSHVVMGEINVPVSEGMSDKQLADVVNAGLATGEEFFTTLDEQFPAAVARRDAQREAAQAEAGQ